MATKSKKFRVAVEGATTDGRELTRQDIVDMAETYNPDTYSARVNMEHFRGLIAGSPFDMLGDVLALSAQEDELTIGGKPEKRLCLYAEIKPLDNLIALNKAGQKIYTSIELQPDFAKSGKAGLVGLAVTDSPASLGTAALQFSAKNPTFFAARKQTAGNLFTEAAETKIEFIEVDDEPVLNAEATGAFAAMRKFFEAFTKPTTQNTTASEAETPPAAKPAAGGAEAELSELAGVMSKFTDGLEKSLAALTKSQAATDAKIVALEAKLDKEPDTTRYTRRPVVTGGDDRPRADY